MKFNLPNRRLALVQMAVAAFIAGPMASDSRPESIVISSTTSTEQSGLFTFDALFHPGHGHCHVRWWPGHQAGAGHGPPGRCRCGVRSRPGGEEKFVAEGFGHQRLPVMYNDFVLIGPGRPCRKGSDIVDALKKLAAGNIASCRAAIRAAPMPLSCASGNLAGLEAGRRLPRMRLRHGPGLSIAASTGPMCWPTGPGSGFQNRADLAVLVEGDKRLFNQYGVMSSQPHEHPVKTGRRPEVCRTGLHPVQARAAITSYKIETAVFAADEVMDEEAGPPKNGVTAGICLRTG